MCRNGGDMTCRVLPEELSAATRLTTLVLSILVTSWASVQLRIAPNALPCSIQRLRLREDMGHNDVVNSNGKSAILPTPPRDFASLQLLQHLQFTV
jgi:hypothetical protein